MSARVWWPLTLMVTLTLTADLACGSPYDRVAYWDGTYGTAWAGDGIAVRDALQRAGYQVLNAAELKTWMDARIADRKLSVVVMCRDAVPITVAETQTPTCTLRRYLDAGGKVVWYADWPLYYQATPTNVTWGSNGAVQVLGFNASTGPNDQNQQVTITPLGRRWGLTTAWSSVRPTSPTVTSNLEVLAQDNNGNAAGWVKHYVAGDTFRGFVRIDDHSGAPVDTAQLMAVAEYYVTIATATMPVPGSGATDVPSDVGLSWTPGQYLSTHDVYFGTAAADVNSATRTDTRGVLVSKGQTGATFDPPDTFVYGQTYYWRIDEVNQSADGTIHKGTLWSFTAEPYAYPLTNITATASSSEKATTGPINTIDGSGLTGDLHGVDSTTMWNTARTDPGPAWIQYQFDNTYKLTALWVWNYNGEFEPVLGYGFKDVTIESSLDGQTWTLVKNAQFAQAPATPGSAHNTTLDLGEVTARYIKLTPTSNWSKLGLTQYGLSEVRFFYVPVQARSPQPAAGAGGVPADSTLTWRPGRDMTAQKVYFGADQSAVSNSTAPAQAVTEHSFVPGALDFGTAYYWRVDEIGAAATYPGTVWSFTTQEYAVVDDFESYTDKLGQAVFDVWIDGLGDGRTGSIVGYAEASGGTFGETHVIHGGRQSMPFEYNNVKTPYYSEAQRTFDPVQNWTTNNANTLVLYFQGFPAGFVDKGNNAFTVSSAGTDIWNNSDQFRFVYKTLAGNGSITARVDSLTRSDPWTKAGVMIRDSLEPGAKHASMVVTPDNSCSLQYRSAAAGAAASTDWSGAAVTAPYWVRITRTGYNFKAESSPDGKTWTTLGTEQNLTMGATVYVGLCVTSHNATAYSTAEFSNVTTSGTGNWQNVSIGVTQRANDAAPLYLTVEDKAGKKKTIVNPDATAVTQPVWTEWKIPLADLPGVNLAAVKTLTLGVGDPAGPKPGAAGLLYLDDVQFGKPIP